MVENKLKNTKMNHRFEDNMKEQKTSRKRALLVLSLLAVNVVAYIFAYSYFKLIVRIQINNCSNLIIF